MGLTRTSPRVSAEVSNSEVASEEPFVHLTEDFFHQLAASLGPHQLHGACITERPAGLAQPQERLFAASEYGFNRGQYLRRAEETVRLSRLEAFLFPATVCQRAGRHDPIQFASRESLVDQHIDKFRHDTFPVERYQGKGMVYRHLQHIPHSGQRRGGDMLHVPACRSASRLIHRFPSSQAIFSSSPMIASVERILADGTFLVFRIRCRNLSNAVRAWISVVLS